MTAPQPDYVQAGAAALAKALAGRTSQAVVQAYIDREAALVRLACVEPHHALETAVCPEIERRAAVLSTELDAIESVYQDLISDRWQPRTEETP